VQDEGADVDTDSLVTLFDRRARHGARRVALRVKRKGIWQPITWQDYLTAAQTAAAALTELGVGAGTRVTLATHPCPQALYVEMAAQALGARLSVVDPAAPAAQLERRLRASPTDVFVGADRTTAETLPGWFAADITTHASYREVFAKPAGDIDAAWTKLLSVRSADVAGVFCSAGTTGPLRAVEVSSATLVSAWQFFCDTYVLTQRDRVIAGATSRVSMHRAAALTIPVLSGATLYFRERLQPFDAAAREVGPTVVLALPSEWQSRANSFERRIGDATGLGRLVIKWLLPPAHDDHPAAGGIRGGLAEVLVRWPIRRQLGWGKVRIACVGGAARRAGLTRRWSRLGITLRQVYSVTDAGSLVACEPVVGVGGPDGWMAPVPGRSVLSESAGSRVALELAIGAPDADRPRIRSGDVGEVDPDGRVRSVARAGDLVTDSRGTCVDLNDVEWSANEQATVAACLLAPLALDELTGLVELDEKALRDLRADELADPAATATDWNSMVDREVARVIDRLDEWLAERCALRVTGLRVVGGAEAKQLVSETGDPCRREIAAAGAGKAIAVHEMSGGRAE
jgi:long-chain acyl-CoA synthetase